MPHTCHAIGCNVEVPARLLMCPRHWRLVPVVLKDAVWKTYRPGQERDKQPSPAYLQVAKAAIEAVRAHEERSHARADARQAVLL